MLTHTHLPPPQGELKGKKGLIPCTFLEELHIQEHEVFAADSDSMKRAAQIFDNVRQHTTIHSSVIVCDSALDRVCLIFQVWKRSRRDGRDICHSGDETVICHY